MAIGKDDVSLAHAPEIGRVVVSRGRIHRRVAALAGEIARCFRGRELTLLAVLTGSLIFISDLIRRLPLRMRLGLVSISSYPDDATESQGPRLCLPVTAALAGRHVLIVDDILDSGRTLAAIRRMVGKRRPASVRTCVLLRKDRPDLPRRTEADFVGFDVPQEFIVGYGLDYDNLYRNLPEVHALRRGARGGRRP
jgi:hypoxanthine phosphoribosyltransferase